MAAPKKNSLINIVVIILVIAIVLSSFVYIYSQKPYAGKVESISIGMLANEGNALIYIANDQKFFASQGLTVTIKDYPSGSAAVKGLLKDEVDIAASSEFVIAKNAIANASIYTFGTIAKSTIEYVVARTDMGISTISDLVGKRIGVSLGTSTEFYLGRFLELNNINENQVNLVDLPPEQTPTALANGTVDAVIAWQPNINTINGQIGNRIVMWSAQASQSIYQEVSCTNNWVVMHPELIVRFLNSLAQAESYAINNPDNAKTIIENRLNYTASYIASVWSENQFSLSLDQALVLAMQDESRWLIQNNLTSATAVPDFGKYVYVDGLLAVKPTTVTIIR
jgi:ABC-type nitrate/sulfonate/bicarbonate transport system substrate-binding protein